MTKKSFLTAGANSLTQVELQQLRDQLESKRAELLGKSEVRLHDATASDEQYSENGDLAGHLVDAADALGLEQQESALLQEVEHALARLEAGTYGVSEQSGEPIPFARLSAVPWARVTAAEAERAERERG